MKARQKRLIGRLHVQEPFLLWETCSSSRAPFCLQALLRSVSLMNRSDTTHRAEPNVWAGVEGGDEGC